MGWNVDEYVIYIYNLDIYRVDIDKSIFYLGIFFQNVLI